ncbi:MAG: hypothetical protein IJR18_01830 [Campylobacter sp.]|nr:hypothetical protein [Campylobacter sp.]
MKVSYKQLPPNLIKEYFKRQDITRNYKSIDICFDKLSDLLQSNGVMIANIELTNGYRSKSNVDYPVTIEFLPLDIDKTTLSIDTMHEMLMDNDLNHILVATSNPNEAFKYRLFLQINPTTIKSEYEYQQLFSNIPDYISFDTNCTDIARCFFIYENSAYTIKEYFKGNPLGIHKKEKSCNASLSPLCNRTTAKSEARSSSVKGFEKHKLTTIPNTLKTQKYLCARDKSWYNYEAIRYNPVLLDEANIYKLLKTLAKQYPDKIRLSDTGRFKYSVRLDEKVCSGNFYFSDDPDYGTHCIMFKDLGTTENSCDIIDFCAKLAFGNTTKQSRDRICAGLMKFFKISEINPYNKTIYPL